METPARFRLPECGGVAKQSAKKEEKRRRNLRTTNPEKNNREAHPIIIIMYIYHALINALSAHMIHINLNMIFYTHVEHSPIKTIYIKYYKKH